MIRKFRRGGTAWRLGLVAGLATAAMMAATITGVVQTAKAAAGGSTLSAGQELQAGEDLVSSGGQYTLIMQSDGNLVTYGNGCVIWASNTAGTGSGNYLAMQGDGNLVIYTSAGKPVWASNTAGTGNGNSLNMQVDGNLVVYTSAGKPVWASGAGKADQLCAPHSMGLDQYIHSSSGQYELLMQDDGNLVLYGPSGATWASNTVGSGGTSVNMQGDGNLVMYTSAAKPVWASNTAGTGSGNHLVMQNDGNLVIYTNAGTPVWASNTSGGGSSDWAGSTFCASYHVRYMGTTFNGVAACGDPYNGTSSNNQGAIMYHGVLLDSVGFQCVELAARYFYYVTGNKPPSASNGGDYAWAVYSAYSKYGISPGGASGGVDSYQSTLVPGDIISMWSPSDPTGHVGVVTSVSLNSALTGTIRVIDENASANGSDVIKVTNGAMTFNGLNEFQWVYNLP
jgi:CHAP domain